MTQSKESFGYLTLELTKIINYQGTKKSRVSEYLIPYS